MLIAGSSIYHDWGFLNNKDNYPLVVSPTNHYLLVPSIKSPTGGTAFSGHVLISWGTSVDTWGYSVTYNVSYSMENLVVLV
ncbi:MAG: hypothetical protein ACXADY_03170 [Candidatus Hodarchaeales archaeon]